MRRGVQIANILVLTALAAWSLSVYDQLPDRIALHFGLDGTPDRWGARSLPSWMVLPMVGIGLTLFMRGVSALVRRNPDVLNMPDAKAYRKLEHADKLRVVEIQLEMLAYVELIMSVLFCVLQIGSYETAMGTSDGLPVYAGVAIVLSMVASLVLAVTTVSRSATLIKALGSARQLS